MGLPSAGAGGREVIEIEWKERQAERMSVRRDIPRIVVEHSVCSE